MPAEIPVYMIIYHRTCMIYLLAGSGNTCDVYQHIRGSRSP
jgi:hypothetical protein